MADVGTVFAVVVARVFFKQVVASLPRIGILQGEAMVVDKRHYNHSPRCFHFQYTISEVLWEVAGKMMELLVSLKGQIDKSIPESVRKAMDDIGKLQKKQTRRSIYRSI